MNKKEILDIIRGRFPEKEYALMQEVRDAAGFGASRSADYIALNLWPSRGLHLHGIEQKSFRSDWTKELKQPEKADAIFKYCDYWWLFTTDENVAKIEEMPAQWGWIHIHKGKVKTMKEAPKLSPCVMDRGFLACMMKRAVNKDGYILQSSIQEKIKEVQAIAENARHYKFDELSKRFNELQQNVIEFQKFTGIDVLTQERWRKPDYEKIGQAVKLISSGGVADYYEKLNHLHESANTISAAIKSTLDALPLGIHSAEQ